MAWLKFKADKAVLSHFKVFGLEKMKFFILVVVAIISPLSVYGVNNNEDKCKALESLTNNLENGSGGVRARLIIGDYELINIEVISSNKMKAARYIFVIISSIYYVCIL